MAIAVALLIVTAVILLNRWHRRAPGPGPAAPRLGRSKCRWQGTGRTTGRMREFQCLTCSAVAYSIEAGGPVTCKASFGRGSL